MNRGQELTQRQKDLMEKAMKDMVELSFGHCAYPVWSFNDYGDILVKDMCPWLVRKMMKKGYGFCINEDGATMYYFEEDIGIRSS